MGLLTAEQLTQIRRQADASLDRICTVTTRTLGASDGAGGYEAETTVTTSVGCRVATPTGRERVIAERLGQEVERIVTLPVATSTPVTATITDNSTGEVYEVVYTNNADSHATAKRVYVRKHTGVGT